MGSRNSTAASKNRVLASPRKHTNTLNPTPEGLVNLIMPHLRMKIKEEIMSLQENLDHLSTAACDISQGINALEVMALGLFYARDPYAEGFNALYNYLFNANLELRKHLDACWKAL